MENKLTRRDWIYGILSGVLGPTVCRWCAVMPCIRAQAPGLDVQEQQSVRHGMRRTASVYDPLGHRTTYVWDGSRAYQVDDDAELVTDEKHGDSELDLQEYHVTTYDANGKVTKSRKADA